MNGPFRAIAGALAGGAGTFILLKVIRLPRFDLDTVSLLWLLLAIVPMVFLGVLIHEAGHLVAGALVRFKPCLFIVGPLKLERQGSRWRLGINRVISKVGGMAAGIPDGAHRLRQRMIVLLAGGPAASLVSGLVAGAALYALDAPGPRVTLSGAAAAAYLLLLMFCLMSFGVGLVSLLPGRSQGYSSDGSQILRFMTDSPDVDAEVAMLAVSTSSIAGCRPRDWDAALLRDGLALPANSPRGPLARLLAHAGALDRGQIDEARRFLAEALDHREQVTRLARPAILLTAARFAALHDHDASAARRWLTEAGEGAMIAPHTRLLAEAAVLHAEGAGGAGQKLAQAEAALEHSIDRGGALMVKDQIAVLRRKMGVPPVAPEASA